MIKDKVSATLKALFGIVIFIGLLTAFTAINNEMSILSALVAVVQTAILAILVAGASIFASLLIIKGIEELIEF